MQEVEVVVAHSERATLRVGDVFLKIDSNQKNLDVEVEAMALAPIPTPEILWRKPPVLALAALPGKALGRLGEPSTASPAAWAAAGAAVRALHDAPLPPWPGHSIDEIASSLDNECDWLITNGVLPADLVTRNRQIAETALRPWTPVFIHGDLQITHVFVDGDNVTGVLDWSEASQGDAMYDLASLTLGHEEQLTHVLAGYGPDADVDVIRAWWSLRSLRAARWLITHGFDPATPGAEFDVLKSAAGAVASGNDLQGGPFELVIRQERAEDHEAVRDVHTQAFGDSERVPGLVEALRAAQASLAPLSLVAAVGERVVGHVMLSACRLDALPRLVDVFSLSPLAVLPEFQRQGIGSRLVADALAEADTQRIPLVFLEGSPQYYGRLGFVDATELGFRPPTLRIPPGAFQVAKLSSYEDWMTGTFVYSDTFWALDCIGLRGNRLESTTT